VEKEVFARGWQRDPHKRKATFLAGNQAGDADVFFKNNK
jgi:hypothetical protein